jgi:hypothetical protein
MTRLRLTWLLNQSICVTYFHVSACVAVHDWSRSLADPNSGFPLNEISGCEHAGYIQTYRHKVEISKIHRSREDWVEWTPVEKP